MKNLGIILSSISNKEILFYFFSHNYINNIISNLLNDIPITDIDYLSYYINFLRTISLKLNLETLNLFFNKNLNSFPLLDNSLILFNHPDVMIQNVSRTIFLSIIKFSYPPLIEYICSLPQIIIFIQMQFKFNNMIYSLFQLKNNQNINEDISDNIKDFIDEISGEILFIQDILSVGNKKINFILINSVFYIVFFNNLFKNLICNFQRNITLYIIYLFLKNIKDEYFLNILIFLLFNEYTHFELKKILDEKLEYTAEYFVYNKNIKVPFDEYLKFNFNENLFNSTGFFIANSNKYKEIKIILDNLQDFKYIEDKKLIFEITMMQIGKYFKDKNNIFDNIMNFHKFISDVTGINSGFFDKNNNSICILSSKYFENLNWNIVNPVRKNLINLMYNVTEKNNTILNYLFLLNYIINLDNISINLKTILKIYSPYQKKKKEVFFDINSMYFYEDEIKNENNSPYPIIYDYSNNSNDNNKNYNVNDSGVPPELFIINQVFQFDFSNSFFEKKYPLDKIDNLTYDSNLIQSLLFKIQNLNDFMPILSYKLIFSIIEKLIINPNGDSIIEQSHLNAINNTYINIINSILYKKKKNKNFNNELFRNAFNLFENAFNYHKLNIEEILNHILQEPYFLYYTNHIKIPKIMKYPNKEIDNFECLLFKFLCLYDLINQIYNKGKNKSLKYSKFPLSFSEQEINVNSIINLFKLKVDAFQTEFKTRKYEKPNLYSLFIYTNYLYFAENLNDNSNSIVKYKFPLSQILIAEDTREPRQLILFINENTIFLEFKSPEKTKEIKLILQNANNNILLSEYSLLESYFSQIKVEFMKFINFNKK